MQLKGKHTFNASPQQLWQLLMDPTVLARITPGISKLEPKGENQFDAIADVRIGPVKGSFKGDLEVAEKKEPSHFLLKVKQNSKIGNVSAEVAIDLETESEQQTALIFDGEAKFSGLLARTGQRVMSGVASTLTKQFFSALEEEL